MSPQSAQRGKGRGGWGAGGGGGGGRGGEGGWGGGGRLDPLDGPLFTSGLPELPLPRSRPSSRRLPTPHKKRQLTMEQERDKQEAFWGRMESSWSPRKSESGSLSPRRGEFGRGGADVMSLPWDDVVSGAATVRMEL